MRFIIAPVFGAALLLGGCSTWPGGGPTFHDVIAQVQQITATACSFVPTAATIGQILALNDPTLMIATQIANAICYAVTQPRAVRPDGTLAPRRLGRVHGVQVQGRFTR